MKKIKLLPSIIMLALCLAVLGIGVYSATTGSNTISGTLTVNSAGHEVDIAVYEATESGATGAVQIDTKLATHMYGKSLGSATGSRAGKSISLTGIAFNSDEANKFADVDMIDLIVAVTNKSNEDVGIYFWDSTYDTPSQVTASDIDGNKVIYGHKQLNGVDSATGLVAHNNIADAEYSFYHHLPGYYTMTGTAGTDNTYKYGEYTDTGSSEGDKRYYTEYMHVYLRLKEVGFTSEALTINLSMTLNVEKYTPNITSGNKANAFKYNESTFIKIEKGQNDVTLTGFEGGPPIANTQVKYVVYPYGITSFVSNAFGYSDYCQCSGLVSISLPTSMTVWGTGFSGCSSLESIIIPNTITSNTNFTCSGCTSLTTFFTSELTGLGEGSFSGCTSLESVILQKITSLGGGCFNGCTSLVGVKMPAIISIYGNAFSNCTALRSIFIPVSCTTLNHVSDSDAPFRGCNNRLVINCEATSKPAGWGSFWNYNGSRYLTTNWGVSA